MFGGQHHIYNRHQVSSSSESSSTTSVHDQDDAGFTNFLKRHCQPVEEKPHHHEEKPHHHSGRHLQELLRNLGRKVLIWWTCRGDIIGIRFLRIGEYEVLKLCKCHWCDVMLGVS